MSKLAQLQNIAHKSGTINISGPVTTFGVRAGAAIGKVGRAFSQLKQMPADQIQKLSAEVQRVSPRLANFLNNLSKVENPQSRAALLFSASQKPDLSAELEAMFGIDEE